MKLFSLVSNWGALLKHSENFMKTFIWTSSAVNSNIAPFFTPL